MISPAAERSRDLTAGKFNLFKPKNQVALLSLMVAGPAGRTAGTVIRTHGPGLGRKAILHTYKHGVPALVNYYALKPTLPALRGDRKIGIRFGADRVMPMGGFTGPLSMYILPSMRKLPVPIFGFGFTAVPMDENRVFHNPLSKSRGGEHTTIRSGTPETATKTIVGPLANKNRQADRRPSSITPRAPLQGGGGETAGGNYKKGAPGTRPRFPPYCWRHKKRHYCKFTK